MASDYEWPAEMTAGVMWKGEIRRATYTLSDAARAWQAFRDFLNGTPEQWARMVYRQWSNGYAFAKKETPR